MSDGYNLNFETWSDLVRSRSRGDTNPEQTRTRSATNASNSSGGRSFSLLVRSYLLFSASEFGPITSPSPGSFPSDSIPSATLLVPTNRNSSASPSNICMMCTNAFSTPHENPHITMQTDFADIRALASRLIAAIHADEVEKKLLR